jgi:hypothetical protein
MLAAAIIVIYEQVTKSLLSKSCRKSFMLMEKGFFALHYFSYLARETQFKNTLTKVKNCTMQHGKNKILMNHYFEELDGQFCFDAKSNEFLNLKDKIIFKKQAFFKSLRGNDETHNKST